MFESIRAATSGKKEPPFGLRAILRRGHLNNFASKSIAILIWKALRQVFRPLVLVLSLSRTKGRNKLYATKLACDFLWSSYEVRIIPHAAIFTAPFVTLRFTKYALHEGLFKARKAKSE